MKRIFSIALAYIISCFQYCALAQTNSSNIDQITQSILQKQIELERLNTQFRIETTLVSTWRQRRMFTYAESNAGLTEASLIKAIPIRYNQARKKIPKPPPDNRNRSRLVAATRVQLVGQCIGAGGDVLELGLNFMHYCSIRKKGYNPSAYQRRVSVLHSELDNLIEQRRVLLANSNQLSQEEMKTAQVEGKLLSDLRDLTLLEYAKYLSGTKRFWVLQNTAYLVDLAKNATGIAGNIVGLQANHINRPHWVGTAFLLSAISGVIVLVTPLVGRVTGNVAGLAAGKTASKELTHVQARGTETFLSDEDKFSGLIKGKTNESPYLAAASKRQQLYEEQEELLLSAKEFLLRQRQCARNTLIENIIFAGAVAPPRITNGILGMIGFWHYYNNSPDRNRLLAAGNTAFLAGNTFNILETARVQLAAEWENHKLANTNLLPRQQFKHRLKLLNNMDDILSK